MIDKERWLDELQSMRKSYQTLSVYVALCPAIAPHLQEIAQDISAAEKVLAQDGFTAQDNSTMVKVIAQFCMAAAQVLMLIEEKPDTHFQ